MIVAGSANPLLLSSAGGYNLTRSLRFRSSASAYLSRTPASAGNRKTFTWAAWVKRGVLNTDSIMYSGTVNASTQVGAIFFNGGDDKLRIFDYQGGVLWQLVTSAVYRDPSAWYHIVVAVDTTQATDTNRIKMYVNGVQITSFSTATYPSQNTDTFFNYNNTQAIGRYAWSAAGGQFDGYMAEQYFIDGQALTPSSFGENNAQTGVWQPKRYAGTYGTNGFYLPFTDNSALTSGSNAGLGKDFSGNGNYWNTNNISITSGSTYDSMTDVPTLTSATASNFATLNPLKPAAASSTITNGNLTGTAYGSGTISLQNLNSTFQLPTSGKYYYEVTVTTLGSMAVGIFSDVGDRLAIYKGSTGEIIYNGSSTTSVSTFTTNDVIALAIDMDAQSVAFYKNNSLITTLTSATYIAGGFCGLSQAAGSGSCVGEVNFGQRPFAYTPPTGFVALNTYNLPTPTIGATASTQANKYFDVNTWTGTGATNVITNSGSMQPDFVWIKDRSRASSNDLVDVLRGVNKALISDATTSEYTGSFVSSFNSNGFSLPANTLSDNFYTNISGDSFVGWQWKANGTGVTNTAGSITSTVSANTSSGFSVVTWTGNGGNATIGHGLGVAPKMVIVKNRTSSSDWLVQNANLTSPAYALVLSGTNAQNTNANWWNSTAPTSSVFSVGDGSIAVNGNGSSMVAYVFSEVAGYSKFGSYTGNGSADGTFVYTGFRPKYVMTKRTDSTSNWTIQDAARSPSNVVDAALFANLSVADNTGPWFDLVSNGFKVRSNGSDTNASGGTYIYMAFAESPFKYSLGR